MRVDTGQFAKKEVRQALAFSLDREAMIQQLFNGRADLGNDHVIAPIYPYFDDSVPQRTRDVEKAKSLLGGADDHARSCTPASSWRSRISRCSSRAMPRTPASTSSRPSKAWTRSTTRSGARPSPKDPPCSGAAELGIVDYGHRATPDVYLNARSRPNGIWNSSQYSSPEFDAAFKEFQSAIGVEAQKAACKKIETILNEDVPIALPYFYNYLCR